MTPKPRRINWRRLCAEKEADILALRQQIDYLVRTIRDMDDKIFSMGQHTSWEAMRPRFLALYHEMTVRKVAESRRIGSLITQELHDTYKPESQALKQITKRKS